MFKKYNFFFFCIHRMGELHYAWETRSNSWITRWGSWTDQEEFFSRGSRTEEEEFFFFFYIYKMEAIPLCLRNTIEQLDHTLGLSDRRRRILFLLLHLQDGVSFIMIEKHDQTAKSNTGALRQKKNNFFSSFTYTGWGVLLSKLGVWSWTSNTLKIPLYYQYVKEEENNFFGYILYGGRTGRLSWLVPFTISTLRCKKVAKSIKK